MTRSSEVVEKAKERDGLECQKCGYHGNNKTRMKAHHIVPLQFDGPDEVENIATLCPHCHRYAPEDFLQASEYETVFQDYISTNVRPEVDFAYFGALATETFTTAYYQGRAEVSDDELDADDLLDAIQTMVGAIRDLPDETEYVRPDYYWLVFASFANHGSVREADRLTQEHIQDELRD